jgi:hypothetical protein
MVWRPTRLTREQLQERRLAAGRLLRAKQLSQAEIAREAREVGVSRASVTRWKQRLVGAGPPGSPASAAPRHHRGRSDNSAAWCRMPRAAAAAADLQRSGIRRDPPMLGPPKARRVDRPVRASLEALVPQGHFYRHLAAVLDLTFVRDLVRDRYATGGRPSLDPVVFFQLQLIVFFEGLRSERQLVATASLHLAHRWYLGYALDEPLPDHSTLSRIRQRLVCSLGTSAPLAVSPHRVHLRGPALRRRGGARAMGAVRGSGLPAPCASRTTRRAAGPGAARAGAAA